MGLYFTVDLIFACSVPYGRIFRIEWFEKEVPKASPAVEHFLFSMPTEPRISFFLAWRKETVEKNYYPNLDYFMQKFKWHTLNNARKTMIYWTSEDLFSKPLHYCFVLQSFSWKCDTSVLANKIIYLVIGQWRSPCSLTW